MARPCCWGLVETEEIRFSRLEPTTHKLKLIGGSFETPTLWDRKKYPRSRVDSLPSYSAVARELRRVTKVPIQ